VVVLCDDFFSWDKRERVLVTWHGFDRDVCDGALECVLWTVTQRDASKPGTRRGTMWSSHEISRVSQTLNLSR